MPRESATDPRSVLLVGCGQLGTELGQSLVEDGWQVYGLRRQAAHLPEAFHRLSVDLTQPVTRSLPDVDTMVITLTPTMPVSGDQPGYVVALRNLAQALITMPSRVVFVSSTRVFDGNPETQPITEHDVPMPVSARAQLLYEAEQLAVELFAAHIVRPAGIYGPGREMLIRKVRAGEAMNRRRRTNRIHQTDLSRVLDMMLTMVNPPAVLHAADQAPGARLGDVVDHIAQRLGVVTPPATMPDEPTGKILDARLLHSILGPLYYPTFREGYDQVIADQYG